MSKKICSLALALTLVLTLSAPAQAALSPQVTWLPDDTYFSDEMGEGLIIARKRDPATGLVGDEYGAYDYQGNVVIPFQYEYLKAPQNGFVAAKKDGKYGYLDLKGNVVIPFAYEYAANFWGGYAQVRVMNDDGYVRNALIDETGRTVLSYMTAYGPIYGDDSRFVYMQEYGWGWNKETLQHATFSYTLYDLKTGEQISSYTKNSRAVETYRGGSLAVFGENGKYGVVDQNGEFIVPCLYAPIPDGWTRVTYNVYSHDRFVCGVDTSGKGEADTIAVVDMQGNVVVPGGKYSVNSRLAFGDDGRLLVEDINTGKMGLIDTSGKEVLPCQYTQLFPYYKSEGANYLAYRSETDPGCLLDGDLRVVFDGAKADLRIGGQGPGDLWIVQENKEYEDGPRVGLIDSQGNMVLPLQQYSISRSSEDALVVYTPTGGMQIPGSRAGATYGRYGVISLPEDVPSDWAAGAVTEAAAAGIVPEGLGSRYTRTATRGEFCALAVQLYETVSGKTVTDRVQFTDTSDVNVQKAAALGIIGGVGGGRANPGGTLTREQAATMLVRLAEACGRPLASGEMSFADGAEVADWAAEAVRLAGANGIMSGTGKGKFSPQGQYTREQSIVTMLHLFRYLSQ